MYQDCSLHMPSYYAFDTVHTPMQFTRRKEIVSNNPHFIGIFRRTSPLLPSLL